MDTVYDFIQPEFLNILFFQQKSVVIFPYVDVKYLRTLEIFTMGYNIIDLDSTALHNLSEVLKLERYNTYSQNPSFFFISNVNKSQLEEIMDLENIHCVINCNEDVSSYVSGDRLIFYNKKNKKFLNFTLENLEFEESLISSSKNISVLQNKILKIKTIASNIYTELNNSANTRNISKLLDEFEPKYWDKILDYTKLFYNIEIPSISHRMYPPLKSEDKKDESSFSDEYDLIVSKNKMIGKEFMSLIHDYRIEKINSANLDNEQLYYPLKLYDYLRNHHWSNNIDKEFLIKWVKMNKTKYILNEDDLSDFLYILEKLKVSSRTIAEILDIDNTNIERTSSNKVQEKESVLQKPQSEKSRFEKLIKIEEKLNSNLLSSKEISYLQQQLMDIRRLLSDVSNSEKEVSTIPPLIKEKITTILEHFYFKRFLRLYQESDQFKFIIKFIGFLEHLNKITFGKDTSKSIPQKIKEFQFPHEIEKDIFLVYKWRKKLAHPKLSLKFEVTSSMEKKCKEIYINFILYFYGKKIKELFQDENWNINNYGSLINDFLTTYYFEPLHIENFFF